MSHIDKNKPDEAWIRELRERFPCEREVDSILTRKLRKRGGPSYAPISLDTLVDGTCELIRNEIGEDFELSRARWLSGGASKLQMAFELTWTQPGVGRTKTDMVLRMEPAESIVETSRMREYEIIRALEGQIPVPPMYWADADARFLPYPAIIYGFAPGVAKPTAAAGGVTGIGTQMPPDLRQALSAQFTDHLAALHRFDWRSADLPSFDSPSPGTEAIRSQLDHWERVWEEDSNEDVPLMRLAMGWLRRNMPPAESLSVVHADYRVGNFLFDEQSQKITAWLDWETAYIGDRHEDLAFAIKPMFGHLAEDGRTFLVGGMIPRDAFLERYEKASGLGVDPDRLRYYDIYCSYRAVAITLATGPRVASLGKTHQDIVVGWLAGISYSLMDDLRVRLAEVL